MKKILMIGTGGTIASEATGEGLAPELTTEQLLAYVPAISDICDVNCLQLLNLDSTNMRPEYWLEVARYIRKVYNDYDGFVTVQTKSCGLTQAISADYPSYLEIRKSKKGFMVDPVGVTVQSITTKGTQELWIGKEKYQHFVGKKLCFLDDVVSTGGTIDAMLELAPKIGVEIAVIACVLTEGVERTEYKGIPLVSLDHIPLPGRLAEDNDGK